MLVLKTDNRWCCNPRYYVADEAENLMQIPPEVTKCIVFIGLNVPNEIKYCATGFFVGVPAKGFDGKYHSYLVTAKHVIDGIEDYYEKHDTEEEKRQII